MLLHIDGSEHRWFGDGRKYELIVILDDATSEIYYAQLMEAENTFTVMAALREVIQTRGVFCSLYSDRASHFFVTPPGSRKVDSTRLTQVGRALQTLGVKMIAAYSPQARGRMERSYGTWQGRLPQELRLRGITEPEAANRFLREEYIAEFNRRFTTPAAHKGTAFVRSHRKDLDWIFSLQHERTVNQDNTVVLDGQSGVLDRKGALAQHSGRRLGDRTRASGRASVDLLWPTSNRRICSRTGSTPRSPATLHTTASVRQGGGMKIWTLAFLESGGSASRPPGFTAILPSHGGGHAKARAAHCVRLRLMVWPR
jgi:hypothetical protein